MTKRDLIKAVAAATGQTQEAAADIINSALDIATDTLLKGDNVTVRGFGTLERRQHKGRTAHNFATGETMNTGTRATVAFLPAQTLKDRLNEG